MSDYELLGVTPQSSFDEIKHSYRTLCKYYHPDNIQTGNAEMFRKINDAYIRVTDNINSNTIPDEEENIDYRSIFDDYVRYALEKYCDINMVIAYIESYMHGNVNAITREKGYRDLFQKYMTPGKVYEIVGGSIFDYVSNIVENYSPAYDAFFEACKATYIKYGRNQLMAAINRAFSGDYNMFTNDGRGLRDNLYNKVTKEEFANIINQIIGDNTLRINTSIADQVAEFVISEIEKTKENNKFHNKR